MDITHPRQQLIFYFDVFVECVLYLFHGVFHIFELILFHNFICFICVCLVRFLFIFTATIIFFPDNRIYLLVCSYIREMEVKMHEEDRYMSRVVRTSICTVTYVSFKFVESEGRKQIMGRSIEQDTNHIFEYGD